MGSDNTPDTKEIDKLRAQLKIARDALTATMRATLDPCNRSVRRHSNSIVTQALSQIAAMDPDEGERK